MASLTPVEIVARALDRGVKNTSLLKDCLGERKSVFGGAIKTLLDTGAAVRVKTGEYEACDYGALNTLLLVYPNPKTNRKHAQSEDIDVAEFDDHQIRPACCTAFCRCTYSAHECSTVFQSNQQWR